MENVKDAINQILEVEQGVEERIAEAKERAKAIIDDADGEALQIIREGELLARSKEGDILSSGKEKAISSANQIIQEGQEIALEVKDSAEKNISKAVDYIVERIKEKYGNS